LRLCSDVPRHVLDVFKDMPPVTVPDAEFYLHRVEAVYEHDAIIHSPSRGTR